MKKRGKMTDRMFRRNIKAGWASLLEIELSEANVQPLKGWGNRTPLWLNCAGLIFYLGISLILVLSNSVSPFSPVLDELVHRDLFKLITDLLI